MRPNQASNPAKLNVVLWTVQVLLALLFLFAGSMKFIMPVAEMTKQMPMPGWFLHFIGLAEICGALGLILPGLFHRRAELTPLAARCLVIIMSGATALMLQTGVAAALVPATIGLLAGLVAVGRSRQPVGDRATARPSLRRAPVAAFSAP